MEPLSSEIRELWRERAEDALPCDPRSARTREELDAKIRELMADEYSAGDRVEVVPGMEKRGINRGPMTLRYQRDDQQWVCLSDRGDTWVYGAHALRRIQEQSTELLDKVTSAIEVQMIGYPRKL